VTDLHTHTLLSDGVLLPSELARRAEEKGYRALGITDHVDASNIEYTVAAVLRVCADINRSSALRAVAGVEITHVAPALIPETIAAARRLGARLVVVHGETLVEPVAPGTNRAAIEGGADILAHPGLLGREEAVLAKERGTAVEISARKGHCLGNGRTAALWREFGFPLVLNTDTHGPDDLVAEAFAVRILEGAGIAADEAAGVLETGRSIAARALAR